SRDNHILLCRGIGANFYAAQLPPARDNLCSDFLVEVTILMPDVRHSSKGSIYIFLVLIFTFFLIELILIYQLISDRIGRKAKQHIECSVAKERYTARNSL